MNNHKTNSNLIIQCYTNSGVIYFPPLAGEVLRFKRIFILGWTEVSQTYVHPLLDISPNCRSGPRQRGTMKIIKKPPRHCRDGFVETVLVEILFTVLPA